MENYTLVYANISNEKHKIDIILSVETRSHTVGRALRFMVFSDNNCTQKTADKIKKDVNLVWFILFSSNCFSGNC